MLLSVGTFAQSGNNGTPLKGDVNEDGVVNLADVTALVNLILNGGGGTAQTTTYYWYVGQTDPSTMTEIDPIVTDTSSTGWRLIGTTKPTSSTYTSSNMLWNGIDNLISFTRDYSYIAVPYTPLQMYDDAGGDGMFYAIQNNGDPKTIDGVQYYIYKSNYKTLGFGMNIYNK